uniref:Uncharacterized protein n=1 Tax=Rhipicephalus zambeziensis TaxID=60191 RepID=A0A224YHU8_9ACAR
MSTRSQMVQAKVRYGGTRRCSPPSFLSWELASWDLSSTARLVSLYKKNHFFTVACRIFAPFKYDELCCHACDKNIVLNCLALDASFRGKLRSPFFLLLAFSFFSLSIMWKLKLLSCFS